MITHIITVLLLTGVAVVPELILDIRLYKRNVKQDKVGQMFWRIVCTLGLLSNVILIPSLSDPEHQWIIYIIYLIALFLTTAGTYGLILDIGMNIAMKVKDIFFHKGTTSKIDKSKFKTKLGIFFNLMWIVIGVTTLLLL